MAQPLLFFDPALEVQPDFAADIFANTRAAMAAIKQCSEEEAIRHMVEAWTAQNEDRRRLWEQQQQQPQAQAQPPQAPEVGQPPQEVQDPAHENLSTSSSPPRTSTKRKINEVALDLQVDTNALSPPSSYALKKLKNYEYVELWYFTKDGCEDASRHDFSVNEGALALTQHNSTISLRPIDSVSASKNVVPDETLTWNQILLAHVVMIRHMKEVGWPENLRDALVAFFYKLGVHRMREDQFGDKAVRLYQAQVRREWHKKLLGPTQQVFNIAAINEERLKELQWKVRYENQDRVMNSIGSWHDKQMLRGGGNPGGMGNRFQSQESRKSGALAASYRQTNTEHEDSDVAPPPYKKKKMNSFRSHDSASRILSACPVCLGRHPHNISRCTSEMLWDRTTKAACCREGKNLLATDGSGTLCRDWQSPTGCQQTDHAHRHRCSGCGDQSHNAQSCPKAQRT